MTVAVNECDIEKCKEDFNQHCNKSDKFKDQKRKFFMVIHAQCNSSVKKNELEADRKCEEKSENDDIVKLLNMIGVLLCWRTEARHEHWTMAMNS